MKVTIGILKEEWEAITWMDKIKDLVYDATEEKEILDALENISDLLERIYKVAENKRIIHREEILREEIDSIKIPDAKRMLSAKEKQGLNNEQIFMKEYGLYTSFAVDPYWSNVFKQIYGYSPSLL